MPPVLAEKKLEPANRAIAHRNELSVQETGERENHSDPLLKFGD
jgi:hypothetical protein